MRRVVVGFDGTANGRAAVARAITLAKKSKDSEVVVVCLHERPPDFSHSPFLLGRVDDSRWFREWLEQTNEDLTQEVRRIRLAGVDAVAACSYDDPAELLQAVADQVDADYIVVPDDSEGFLHDLVIGSTAKRIRRTSPIPVVAVRDEQ